MSLRFGPDGGKHRRDGGEGGPCAKRRFCAVTSGARTRASAELVRLVASHARIVACWLRAGRLRVARRALGRCFLCRRMSRVAVEATFAARVLVVAFRALLVARHAVFR